MGWLAVFRFGGSFPLFEDVVTLPPTDCVLFLSRSKKPGGGDFSFLCQRGNGSVSLFLFLTAAKFRFPFFLGG